jgi:transcriptional regulator with XRE-family HTH domain
MAAQRATSTTPVPVQRALRVLGEHVRAWRKLRGLTAAQVADRAGIGRDALRALETGAGGISLEKTLRVARALGVMDQLIDVIDPYDSDIGRLRADEQLPQRVRPRRVREPSDA